MVQQFQRYRTIGYGVKLHNDPPVSKHYVLCSGGLCRLRIADCSGYCNCKCPNCPFRHRSNRQLRPNSSAKCTGRQRCRVHVVFQCERYRSSRYRRRFYAPGIGRYNDLLFSCFNSDWSGQLANVQFYRKRTNLYGTLHRILYPRSLGGTRRK